LYDNNHDQVVEVRRAFGLLFVSIAIAVGSAAILGEMLPTGHIPSIYNLLVHAFVWIASFAITFGMVFKKFRHIIKSIAGRMKNSTSWPSHIKAFNGLCWAAPFAMIPLLPFAYQYLILLGIGLGNFSTYLFMRRYSNSDNPEQMIVAVIALIAIPIAFELDSTLFSTNSSVAVMLSRILISLAYACGGVYALFAK
jgi:hypothetical protein